MQNVEVQITDDERLILIIDLKQETGFTNRSRSVRIASTGGNLQLWKDVKPHPKGIRLNLNVFRSLTEPEQRQAAKEMQAR